MHEPLGGYQPHFGTSVQHFCTGKNFNSIEGIFIPMRRNRAGKTKFLLIFSLAVIATLALAASASASKSQLSVLEDPARILSADQNVQNASLDEIKALGADIVKIPVQWRYVAPNGTSAVPPTIDLTNPDNYPVGAWDVIDRAVAGAETREMKVWLMITAPAPRWAVSREASDYPGSYEPDPVEYGRFTQAVGTRYPSVKYFSVWNEPNLGRYIQPQRNGRTVTSAVIYRDLYQSGYAGLRAAGRGSATIMFGELLPNYPARRSNGVPPLEWLRAFFCIDKNGKKLTGAAAKYQKCSGIQKVNAKGFAYHPYTWAGGPLLAMTKKVTDAAFIQSLNRIHVLMDQAVKQRRLSQRKIKVYSSEFGFQSNPPDRIYTPIKKIPLFLNASEYISYIDPRVATYSQYLIVDDTDLGGFQSGLRFADGDKKTAVYAAYQTPIVAIKGKSPRQVTIWGSVRTDKTGVVNVEIQTKSGGSWKTVTEVPVRASRPYLNRKLNITGAAGKTFRLKWSGGVSRSTKPGKAPVAFKDVVKKK